MRYNHINKRSMDKMMKNLVLSGMILFAGSAWAYKHTPDKSGSDKSTGPDKSVSAGCLPPSTSAELNVNNVRALIHSGGDMWWDLIQNARYEVPKGSGRNSMFVGTLWIGGRDAQTQTLRLAAQRYRSNGVDYWTGPLDQLGTASIDAETCALYDKIWSITRQQVELFRLCNCIDPDDPSCDGYTVPDVIKKWPGNPMIQANGQHLNMDQILAPFADVNNDGVYSWQDCDYPFYDLDNNIDCRTDRSAFLYGDFTLWWVFNDKGNVHGESAGSQIGMEIRAQAFGFNTNDEINNMTFYNYQLINRGTTTLASCYFGVNTDADLGCYSDDYTGCDVGRGFGYMYNGDCYDENCGGQLGYGSAPPAIGVDFFLGPYLDSNGVAEVWDPNNPDFGAITSLTDTTRFSNAYGINGVGFDDNIVDNERYGMRRFVYYNNGSCPTNCDPETAPQYYNFLRAYWKDASRMVFGGNGVPGTQGTTTTISDFMFPGDSDPLNWGTKGINPGFEWTEVQAGNQPGDRRFVQSAGPFTLKPGAVNDLVLGVVWARASNCPSFESVLKVRKADDKAQSLFENCFRVLNGPDAPDLNIQELDRELILFLTNKSTSNNYLNEYEELNYFIPELEESTIPLTQDTTIYVPAWMNTVDLGGGNTMWVYQNQVINGNPADSIIYLYDASATIVDSLFGFFSNPSTPIVTTINIGQQKDTIYFDRMIRFEGYMIYQLKDATVTATDIFGTDGASKARLVAQCDIRNFDATGNPIGTIINYEYDEEMGFSIPRVKVQGSNEGIIHSFKVTEDFFATGTNKRLVNHKTYYYMALAYGYNNFKKYDPNDPSALDGQKEPFFLGRRNIKVYSGIPHIPAPELGGTVLQSQYGMSPRITRIEGRGNGGNYLDLTKETIEAILNSPTHRVDNPTYDYGAGPIGVKIIDPLKIRPSKYVLKIVDTDPQLPTSNPLVNKTSRWVLLELGSPYGDTVAVSDKNITDSYEQIVYDRRNIPGIDDKFLGFSINIRQTQNIGPTWQTVSGSLKTYYENNNGLISATIDFEKPSNEWIGFFPDNSINNPGNWVRSGTTVGTSDNSVPNAAYLNAFNSNKFVVSVNMQGVDVFIDPENVFESNISFYGGGGIVPYLLTNALRTYKEEDNGPSYPGHCEASSITHPQNGNGVISSSIGLQNFINSVDIVLTSDKSKWSRCPVFETQDFDSLAYKHPSYPNSTKPTKLSLRHSPSVDKNGNYADVNAGASNNPESPNYINAWGMGWFPGYAIDVETGERLNIGFGEDSYLSTYNGRDMKFNPTQADPTKGIDGWVSNFGDFLFAGKHYIYLFGSNPQIGGYAASGHYDEGATIVQLLTDNGVPVSAPAVSQARNVWRNCMWVGKPFHVKGKNWLDGDVTIKLRVFKNYQPGLSAINYVAAPQNNNNPMYEFSFDDLSTITGNNDAAKAALDLIQVVPNPYYAASDYETNQVDNRVKVVNLPDECTVTIYSLNGTLVRRFEKGTSDITSIDWDLKNYKNIPVASGLYIFHIKAPGIGERIIKWYGVLRPFSLDNF